MHESNSQSQGPRHESCTRSRKTPIQIPTAPLSGPRVFLALMVALGLSLAAGIVVAQADEWEDERYASRASAAEPAAQPFMGPPIGSPYAPSPVIFPPQEIPIRFFHDKHIELGLECTQCHDEATDSVDPSDRMLPEMEVCLDCHAIDDGVDAFPPADCSTCHTPYAETPARFDASVEYVDEDTFRQVENPPPLVDIPTPQIKFPHKAHVDEDIECAECHGDMESIQLATRYNMPTMAKCLSCHTGHDDEPSDDCSTCHLSLPDGRLATNLPTGTLMPTGRFRADDHRFDYLERHRTTAASDQDYCTNCHTEQYCEDCHNGVFKPVAIHPPNYVQLHAVDAYQDQSDCESCHTTQDFCIGCHEQVGLSLAVASAGETAFQFHPDGWIPGPGDAPGMRPLHADAAQRNIGACASCHSESTCIDCHSTQSIRVAVPANPHPPDWVDICGAALERNMTSCVKCHLVDDPLLDMCR